MYPCRRADIARKREVAQRVADVLALVDLHRVHAVAVVAEHQVGPGVDGGPPQRHLPVVGHVVLLVAPVVGDDHQLAARVAQRLNVALDALVDVGVVAVERLVGKHADVNAVAVW